MRSTRWYSVGAGGATTIAALAFAGCTHEVEHFQAYQGAAPIGTIGSVSIGDDDGGDEEDSGEDEGEDSSGESPSDDGGDPSSADDGEADDGGSAPASDDGGGSESGGAVETGSGDPVLDACLDVAVNECETCACNLCLDPLYACQQDQGCVAMRDCAQMTGCAGADCLEPCGAVIDMYGGPFGSSGALALALSDCLSASCPACF